MSKLKNVIHWRKDMGNRVFNLMCLEALQETFIHADFITSALECFGFILADENDFRETMASLQEFADYINEHEESRLLTFENAIFEKMSDLIKAHETAERLTEKMKAR